jgi:chemotaxis-related protein WspD
MAPEYRLERTSHFAREKKLAASGKISAMLFRVGPEWLSLPTTLFQEVAPNRLIHSLPHRRQGIVLGLVNVRGELLICVSLARLLGIVPDPHPPSRGRVGGAGPADSLAPVATARHRGESDGRGARDAHDRLLVAAWEDSRFAFPVSEVHGIHRFDPQLLKEPPATVSQSGSAFSRGVFLWQDKTVGALDPDTLFSALNRSLT